MKFRVAGSASRGAGWLLVAGLAGFLGGRPLAVPAAEPTAEQAKAIATAKEALDRGRASAGQEDFAEAVKAFDQVTKISGRDPGLIALRADAHVERSKVQSAQGKYLEAIDSCYFAILEENSHFDAHLNRGLAYLARHEYRKAINSFGRCLYGDAQKSRGWSKEKAAAAQSHRGFAQGATGNLDGDISDQGEALKADPTLAIAHERRAAARIAKALQAAKPNFTDAIKDVAKALELDPKMGEALCDRSLLRAIAGDVKGAAVDADAAIAAAPRLARAHFQRGVIAMREKDAPGAVKHFDSAIGLDPKYADAFVERGLARLATKGKEDYDAAVADFTAAIEMAPRLASAYAGRAQARRKLGAASEDIAADVAEAKKLSAPRKAADDAEPPSFFAEHAGVDPARYGQTMAAANRVDELVAANYAKFDVKPMPLTTDEQFVRRIYLDVVGTIPTYKQTTAFLASSDPDKRAKLIDELLGSEGYPSHFFNFWADILRYRDRLSEDVRGEPWREWIKRSLAENKPYDPFVREMLTAEGLPWENPATGYLQRDPGMPLDNINNTIRIFLGTRIGCAQCHNHPFDKWTQRQFYEAAAFVYPTQTQAGAGDKRFWKEDFHPRLRDEYQGIEQEEEERRQKYYQFEAHLRTNMKIVNDNADRKIQLPKDYAYDDGKPGDVVQPKMLFGPEITPLPGETSRQTFARWLTSKDNPRFALTIANRLWRQVFGAGQIEPVDDMMDSTVAENPALMAFLESEMKRLDFNVKEYLRILLNSQTYQRQAFDREVAIGAPYHFPGPMLRRMTAEQAWDSFLTLARPEPGYQEVPMSLYAGAVAVDLVKDSAERVLASRARVVEFDQMRSRLQEAHRSKYDRSVLMARASELPSPVPPNHFLRMFGQSDRELISASSTGGAVPQVLFMYNGPVTHMLLAEGSAIYNNIVNRKLARDAIKVVFLTILNREPDEEELELALLQVRGEHKAAVAFGNVVWSLVNTREFMFVQ